MLFYGGVINYLRRIVYLGTGIYDQKGHWIKVDKVEYNYLK